MPSGAVRFIRRFDFHPIQLAWMVKQVEKLSCWFNAQPKAPASAGAAGAFGWALNDDTATVSVTHTAPKWRCPTR